MEKIYEIVVEYFIEMESSQDEKILEKVQWNNSGRRVKTGRIFL